MHKWFAATACPGPYLESKFPYIAQEVNKRLSGDTPAPSETVKPSEGIFTVKVSISDLGIYKRPGADFTGKHTGKGVFTITEVKAGAGSASGWGKLKSGAGWVNLDQCESLQAAIVVPFLVRVDVSDLSIYREAGGGSAKTGKATGRGIFTITEVKAGAGSAAGWGKLKSGAGWVNLDQCVKL